ncbi:MAG: NAD(P)-dependent oxidoreductase [Acidobacteriota bacterium]|nr:NAD(P)-dependent oxidoreductase [Acidobacteriota bacterium]MDH3522975.1 NAD(P)-dependent oxidoreductase [Acidobacteriota bacterium]
MSTLKDKTLFITGASRGIGKAIALRAAADGANIVIVAKTKVPHPKLPGTIFTAAEEVEAAGGRALPVATDIRDEAQVREAVNRAVDTFGGIDALVCNASAITLSPTLETPMKRFDLMWSVNARGTFLCSQACLPHLQQAENPHILVMSPPLNMNAEWFRGHLAYTISKYGMSMCVLGLAEEFRKDGVGVNALWPRTVIRTAALNMLVGTPLAKRLTLQNCREPRILADAAHAILTQKARICTGHFYIDEQVLKATGVTDFEQYAVDPEAPLARDLFLD